MITASMINDKDLVSAKQNETGKTSIVNSSQVGIFTGKLGTNKLVTTKCLTSQYIIANCYETPPFCFVIYTVLEEGRKWMNFPSGTKPNLPDLWFATFWKSNYCFKHQLLYSCIDSANRVFSYIDIFPLDIVSSRPSAALNISFNAAYNIGSIKHTCNLLAQKLQHFCSFWAQKYVCN